MRPLKLGAQEVSMYSRAEKVKERKIRSPVTEKISNEKEEYV